MFTMKKILIGLSIVTILALGCEKNTGVQPIPYIDENGVPDSSPLPEPGPRPAPTPDVEVEAKSKIYYIESDAEYSAYKKECDNDGLKRVRMGVFASKTCQPCRELRTSIESWAKKYNRVVFMIMYLDDFEKTQGLRKMMRSRNGEPELRVPFTIFLGETYKGFSADIGVKLEKAIKSQQKKK